MALPFLLGPASFSQSHQNTQDGQTLQIAVDLVLVDVSVQDRDGQPVHNLDRDSFKIFEDKIEQPISYFSKEESPVTWGLVLDRSSSMQGMMKDVYESAVNVIDVGTKEDEMFIMTFSNKTENVAELTLDRRKLTESIFGLKADGSTALYDALASALDYIKGGRHRKKVLVVITDGADNRSRTRRSQLVNQVKESDVLIYTVGMYGAMAHNPTESRLIQGPIHQLEQLVNMVTNFLCWISEFALGPIISFVPRNSDMLISQASRIIVIFSRDAVCFPCSSW